MAHYLRPRRGNAGITRDQNITLKVGEMFLEIPDNQLAGRAPGRIIIGDGVHSYNQLNYASTQEEAFKPFITDPSLYTPIFNNSTYATSDWRYSEATSSIDGIGVGDGLVSLPVIIENVKKTFNTHEDSVHNHQVRILDLESHVNDAESDISSLENITTEHTSKLTNLQTQINNTNGRIDTNVSSINEINIAINTIDTNIQNLSTAISRNADNITTLSSGINNLGTDLNSLEYRFGLSTQTFNTFRNNVQNTTYSLSVRISANEQAIQDIVGDSGSVEGRVQQLSTAVSRLQTSTTNLNSTLNTLADNCATTFSRFATSVSNLRSTISSNKSSISTLNTNVTNLTSTVSGLKTTVTSLKTSVSNLNTTVSNIIIPDIISLKGRTTIGKPCRQKVIGSMRGSAEAINFCRDHGIDSTGKFTDVEIGDIVHIYDSYYADYRAWYVAGIDYLYNTGRIHNNAHHICLVPHQTFATFANDYASRTMYYDGSDLADYVHIEVKNQILTSVGGVALLGRYVDFPSQINTNYDSKMGLGMKGQSIDSVTSSEEIYCELMTEEEITGNDKFSSSPYDNFDSVGRLPLYSIMPFSYWHDVSNVTIGTATQAWTRSFSHYISSTDRSCYVTVSVNTSNANYSYFDSILRSVFPLIFIGLA